MAAPGATRRATSAALTLGGYLALALAPLAVAAATASGPSRGLAVEIGAAAGLVAFAVLAIECTLVSRFRLPAASFGTDALLAFHRLMALAALGFVAAHVVAIAGVRGVPSALIAPAGGRDGGAGALAVWLLVGIVASSIWRRRLRLSYEAWRAIHTGGAALMIGMTVVHVSRLGRADARVVIVLGIYAALFVALLARQRVGRPFGLWRRPWVVVENRDVGASTRVLTIRPETGSAFSFAPGQFVWLVTGRSPWSGQQHPISVASSAERPATGGLELAVKDLGDWSGRMVPALTPGARVWVDGPHGVFTPDRRSWEGLLLVAGGIGITPMRSMLLTMRDRGDRRPVVLVYAANSWARVVFRAELEALAATLALRVVWVFEEPDPAWDGERGFVTLEMLRRHLPRDVSAWECFVCGPTPMLDAMERVVPAAGIAPGRLHTERFDVV